MKGNARTVCVFAPLGSGEHGGIEQYVLGLGAGLSKLEDGDEEYAFVTDDRASQWLRRYLAGPARLVEVPRSPRRSTRFGQAGRVVSSLYAGFRRATANVPILSGIDAYRARASSGIERELGAAVVHFPTQAAFLTSVPSIYQPHDLQHLHLSRFFTRRDWIERERVFGTHCAAASLVVTSSSWAREDVARHYAIPPERMTVIPPGPPTAEYAVPTSEALEAARLKLAFDGPFVLYPAQTWPHKNHAGLLRALAILKARGLTIRLVAPGRKNEHFPTIERLSRELGVAEQVRFPGFITPEELQCLYRLCRAVVVPTFFEAASFPVMEAQLAGLAVACSAVTSLPLQIGDSGLLFDPGDPRAIADAMERLWLDGELRARLAEMGRANALRFTWGRAARVFRAHYRRLAGWPMTEEDRSLIAAAPGL
jgi:glycosyltransferase involved in cell wall biosynthesis